MKALCINGLVDGLTNNKIYTVTSIFIRNDGITYGMIDDYGVYNEFNAIRFKLDTEYEILLNNHDGISLSVKLK